VGKSLVLYHLFTPLVGSCRLCIIFNVFNYITFRSAGAAVTGLLMAFVVGPFVIRRLRTMKVRQVIRAGTPDSHQEKSSTPTMGGVIFLIAGLVPTLLWTRLNNRYVWVAVIATAWMGCIGFIDDYLKLKQQREGKKNEGLVERYKLVGQITLGVAMGVFLWLSPLSNLPGASTTLPFYKYVLVVPVFAWLYVPWIAFVLTGTSNAVNLTDGLDGLATGLAAIAFATFAIFAYLIGRFDASQYLQIYYLRGSGELTVFCMSLLGALIGFLWYNTHPAEVFMGDTGSLALGGALGAVAILLKSEFLLLLIGAVFAAETVSVIVQRSVFKYRRARHGVDYAKAHRIFLRAPLHHHFELKGWQESQVVVRFWILGILSALVALSTLKLR
jgi:phospho-N-acetylmuramoyl-pentapeptide-transferase